MCASPQSTEASGKIFLRAYLALLVVAVVIVFSTLLKYFLAQDDFVLLEKAAWQPRAAIFDFFRAGSGHFRPLTKGAYFVAMWRIAGLSGFAYHAASLAVHALNVALLWRLVHRLRPRDYTAPIAATLFGLSTAFFHVLAWAACMQQLMGLLFALLSIEWGCRAFSRGAWRNKVISLACYLFALGSVEQTVLLPAVLVLVLLRRRDLARPAQWNQVLAATLPHWIALGLFAAFVLLWKTLPGDGTYRWLAGENVALNLWAYLGWSGRFLGTIPMNMLPAGYGLTWGHAVVGAAVLDRAIRRQWLDLVFGLGFFFATILPTLFLVEHTFYLHTYVPAAGVAYLVATMVSDLVARIARGRESVAARIVAAGLLVMTVASFVTVRRSESAVISDRTKYRRSFVIRRELAAARFCSCVEARRSHAAVDTVLIVYGREEKVENTAWSRLNVVEAIGGGSAIRLLYDNPALVVRFVNDATFVPVTGPGTEVFFHDDVGNCRTAAEMRLR